MVYYFFQLATIADRLSTKDARQNWEDLFYKTFLLVAHKKVSIIVTEANDIIKEKDVREDENQSKIYFMAYELLNKNAEKDPFIYEKEQFWKFRPSITFDMMRIEFTNSGFINQFPILKKFSDLVSLCCWISWSPSFLRKLLSWILVHQSSSAMSSRLWRALRPLCVS